MILDPTNAAFAALAQRIYSAGTSEQIYQAVVDTAVEVVGGCNHSCIMLVSGGTVNTVAATDAVAVAVDEFERALGEGPCLDAILDEAPHLDPDLTTASPWPRLAEQVVALTPVRGMIGFRLLVDGRKAGALNLFSDTPGALTADSVSQASVLASFASVAVMAAAARERSSNLLKALDSNREIGKAVGLLMAAHKVSQERAFEILDQTSQSLNMKLAEVAAKVVQGQQDQYQQPS